MTVLASHQATSTTTTTTTSKSNQLLETKLAQYLFGGSGPALVRGDAERCGRQLSQVPPASAEGWAIAGRLGKDAWRWSRSPSG